jgi:hypothetical protein
MAGLKEPRAWIFMVIKRKTVQTVAGLPQAGRLDEDRPHCTVTWTSQARRASGDHILGGHLAMDATVQLPRTAGVHISRARKKLERTGDPRSLAPQESRSPEPSPQSSGPPSFPPAPARGTSYGLGRAHRGCTLDSATQFVTTVGFTDAHGQGAGARSGLTARDGSGGSGYADRPPGFLPLTWARCRRLPRHQGLAQCSECRERRVMRSLAASACPSMQCA